MFIIVEAKPVAELKVRIVTVNVGSGQSQESVESHSCYRAIQEQMQEGFSVDGIPVENPAEAALVRRVFLKVRHSAV
jgi:hypothetical protein